MSPFFFFRFFFLHLRCSCFFSFFPPLPSPQATSNILDVWEGTREALGSLSVDTTLAYSLERRVAALEGVRASDQDICQVFI